MNSVIAVLTLRGQSQDDQLGRYGNNDTNSMVQSAGDESDSGRWIYRFGVSAIN